MTVPTYLKRGDTIAICCPAGYMNGEKVVTCIATLQNEGYEVIVGETVGGHSPNYFSGTDEERLTELQQFLDNKNINAILCARGGYGISRIIDQFCFKKFLKYPKWIIGFSDVTVIHSYLFSNFKIASLHASMAAAFNDGGDKSENILSLLAALKGTKGDYHIAPNISNKNGIATGKLIGGNLTLLANGIGTSSDIKTNKCILFLEDLDEQLYNIDRMLVQVKRSGMLKDLAGLVVGGFTDLKDTERPFGKNIYEIFTELVAEYDYPVCFDFPVSHSENNVALKHGMKHTLFVDDDGVMLKEI
ncbi:MAG: LD-carboxypeptidase [Ferruginibacter sp.]|nr:LD-carboxypeptidase [Ferruginibacter sp.]